MVQRYKFESKSQLGKTKDGLELVVSNGSKVQIWKQITTLNIIKRLLLLLFPMVQRYKFESKSQPVGEYGSNYGVVSNGSKVQIWKQITTLMERSIIFPLLFPMVQRYKFESKSQLFPYISECWFCCFQWFKGTNLKANHNSRNDDVPASKVVSNGSKVQIWKQITTGSSSLSVK